MKIQKQTVKEIKQKTNEKKRKKTYKMRNAKRSEIKNIFIGSSNCFKQRA